MAGLLPSYILRQCWARVGAYKGQAAAIEASYLLADPSTNSVNASFTKSVLLDGLISIEQEIATAVAANIEHPWRAILQDTTAAIASGGLIPKVGISTATAKIIGEYGQVKDSVTPFRPLTPDLTVAEIRALNQNIGTMFSMDYFSCAYQVPRLWHTRSVGAVIDVCTYDFDTRKTAIFADGELLFTEAEGAYFSGLMSLLMNTDALLTELSKMYAPRYAEWLKIFRAGEK
jgi:hypothetical protein